MSRLVRTVVILSSLCLPALLPRMAAADDAKADVKEAGHEIKQDAKAAGHATVKKARQVKRKVKRKIHEETKPAG